MSAGHDVRASPPAKLHQVLLLPLRKQIQILYTSLYFLSLLRTRGGSSCGRLCCSGRVSCGVVRVACLCVLPWISSLCVYARAFVYEPSVTCFSLLPIVTEIPPVSPGTPSATPRLPSGIPHPVVGHASVGVWAELPAISSYSCTYRSTRLSLA